MRTVDMESAVLPVGTARGHSVVVVEAVPPFRLIKQRLMRHRRATTNIADLDRAGLIDR